MADTDQIEEDEVLRRMLATPPEKHKPLGTNAGRKRSGKGKPASDTTGGDIPAKPA